MVLADFIKILDTTEPINVYLDGCWDRECDVDKIPNWYKKLELTDIWYDNEGLTVNIYTN